MSTNHRNPVEYATIVFAFVISVFSMLSAGNSFNQRHYAVGISAVLSGLFMAAVLIAVSWSRYQALRDKLTAAQRDLDYSQKRLQDALDEARNLRGATQTQNAVNAPADAGKLAAAPEPKMDAELKELLDKVFEPILEDAKDLEVLKAIVQDMGLINDDPNPKDFPAIAKAFHENTDRYVKFESLPDGKFCVDFSATPFEDTTAPDPKTGKPARTAGKPLTKSQQRRINASKGKGAFTDDELKEQRNAKRRATREAKKATAAKAVADKAASGETTTTTTVKE